MRDLVSAQRGSTAWAGGERAEGGDGADPEVLGALGVVLLSLPLLSLLLDP